MSQPVPEACEVQQLPNEAKIFANFSLPYIRIISQLCITRIRDMFLFVFHSGMHRSVVNHRSYKAGNSLGCFCSDFQWYIWWGGHFSCIHPETVTGFRKEMWGITDTFFLVSRAKGNCNTPWSYDKADIIWDEITELQSLWTWRIECYMIISLSRAYFRSVVGPNMRNNSGWTVK